MKQSPPEDYAQSNGLPQSKKNSWGIRGRIAAAFIIVSIITLGTGIIAVNSYNTIDKSLKAIEEKGIRVTARAFSITRDTAEVARNYSTLLAATDPDRLIQARRQIESELSDLNTNLTELKDLVSDAPRSKEVAELEETINVLAASLDPISDAIGRRITIKSEINQLNERANAAYLEIRTALTNSSQHDHPNASDGGSPSTLQIESSTGEETKHSNSDQELRAKKSKLYDDIHVEIDNVITQLSNAMLAEKSDLLTPLANQFRKSAKLIRSSMTQLSDEANSANLKTQIKNFLKIGEGNSGLISKLGSKISLVTDLQNLIRTKRANVQNLVKSAEATSRKAAIQSIESIKDARVSIIVSRNSISLLVFASFLFSLLFAWYYVGEGVIKRLARIDTATRELATGNLDVEVPHTGADDEIENIANALEIFKANAIAARDMEIEKEQARLLDLQGREASFRFLFKRNPIPMWVYELESKRILAVNESTIKHYGYSRDEFLTKTIYALRSSNNRVTPEEFERGMRYGTRRSESSPHTTACGNEIDVVTYCRELVYEGKNACLVAAIDVTERNQAQARVAHMAHHDSLTELANRNKFNEHLENALESISRNSDEGIALHCLDLDKFKFINDTLGHATGDAVLKMVAQRLLSCVRDIDVVARMGGDEFAIIQRNVRSSSAPHVLAKRIIDSLKEPYDVNGMTIAIGASVGISQAPADGKNPDELLKNADLALYSAKEDGRGNYRFFSKEMGTQLKERQKLEFDLKRALENDEIFLAYMPYFSVATNETLAFEAMLRWKHPEQGILEAKDFAPLAKDTGLIVSIGNWALKEACKQAARWPTEKKLAISVSDEQLRSSDLHSVVTDALHNSNLEPQRLELELTESIAALNLTSTIEALNDLKRKGVCFTMDNFCNGQSTLDQVRKFRFDKVKIDSSFINTIVDSGDSVSILRAIIKLASSMEFKILAKEIHTLDQLNIIRAEGCAEMQGQLFCEPMNAGQIEKFLTQKSAAIRGAA